MITSFNFLTAYPELYEPLARLNSYRLPANATLADKVKYSLYRLWNAVAAIFNKSDWQCVRKDLIEQQVPRLIKSILGDDIKYNTFNIERIVDAALSLCTDGQQLKFEHSYKSEQAKTLEKFYELIKSHSKTALIEDYKFSEEAANDLVDLKNPKAKPYSMFEEHDIRIHHNRFSEKIKTIPNSREEIAKIRLRIENFVIASGQNNFLDHDTVQSINAAIGAIHLIYCENLPVMAAKIKEYMDKR